MIKGNLNSLAPLLLAAILTGGCNDEPAYVPPVATVIDAGGIVSDRGALSISARASLIGSNHESALPDRCALRLSVVDPMKLSGGAKDQIVIWDASLCELLENGDSLSVEWRRDDRLGVQWYPIN